MYNLEMVAQFDEFPENGRFFLLVRIFCVSGTMEEGDGFMHNEPDDSNLKRTHVVGAWIVIFTNSDTVLFCP